jgi:hypothetical protein
MRARHPVRDLVRDLVPACGPAAGLRRACALVLTSTVLIAPLSGAQTQTASRSQSSAVDTRWYPWLGCWQADSDAVAAARYSCVVPTSQSTAVDVVGLVGGSVVSRSRIDANGRSHPIEQAGCQGDETATWSDTRHRLYLRSSYTCGGVEGTSTRIFAIAPGGDWLEAETVRSGGGSVDHVTRRHDAGIPTGAPAQVARALAGHQLATSTARAAAAAPIAAADVVEAVHSVDAGTVRSWLVASNAHVQITGAEAQAMMHADVPTSVMQAMMGENRAVAGAGADEAKRAADEYLRSTSIANSGIAAQGASPESPMYTGICNAGGCATYPNAYSQYNGYSTYPYGVYPYGVAPYGGYWVGAPIVIVHRGHNPVRPPPIEHRPGPAGIPTPRRPEPQAPVVHMPSRRRP